MSFRYPAATLFAATVFAAAFAALPASCTKHQPARVFVFGIDGGTWDVARELIENGEMPNLARFYHGGVHGVLRSRPPAISPVVWTTIFTGQLPEVHGVSDWKTSQSTHRKVKALWNIASAAGRTTDVFNVPSTWPPEPVQGVLFSGFPLSGSTVAGNTGVVIARAGLADGSTPFVYRDNQTQIATRMEGLAEGAWSPWFDVALRSRPSWKGRMRIKRLGRDSFYLSPFYRIDDGIEITYPADARERIRAQLGDEYIPEGPGWSKWAEPETPEYLYEHLLQVADIQTRAVDLFAPTDWDLLVYVDTFVDRVSHPYWAYMRPSDYEGMDAAKAAKYRDAVKNAYRETDRRLGELVGRIRGEYYFVAVSDHGFHSNVNPKQAMGTHDFDGIYLFAGPGLSRRAGPVLNIEDVGPSVLYLLGLPSARDMAGRIAPFLTAELGGAPAQIASYETEARPASDLPVDEQTWEQLRGLGYVDGAPPRSK